MLPDPTITISCDELLEFEEDAAAFAQGEPEFVHGPVPAAGFASVPSVPPPQADEAENKESA